MPAPNRRFGATAALPRSTFPAKLTVRIPPNPHRPPPLRQAARTLAVTRESAVPKGLTE